MRQEEAKADWNAFAKAVPWFTPSRPTAANVIPRLSRGLQPDAAIRFPTLNQLLQNASLSEVAINGKHYELFSWTNLRGERFGWLCMMPSQSPPLRLNEAQRLLLRSFGGIVEHYNEPEDTWLLNLNDALTERAAAGSDSEEYAAVLDGPLPINAAAHYPIAIEANGNRTLCQRDSGSVLMFAPDHAFDHLTVFPGCPEYRFYTINGIKGLCDWVEAVAYQWAKHVADAS